MTSFSESIKQHARRLGFTLVGITSPEPPAHYSTYEGWLAAGRHGDMLYLGTDRARSRRADPREILAEVASILVLGFPYAPAGPPASVDPAQGRIAAYAWQDDYHETLKPRLQALVAFIEEAHGAPVPNRWYTDTGPILERDLAQRAGLGWIGKNTCLIHPRSGSYFFLAEILLGIPLDFDPPFVSDHCGSCTRCIDACPTACILPDRTLDARRCISYLTIELKGPIPIDLRSGMENWIFGCDVCQQVCPWNIRFALPDGNLAGPPAELATPALEAELGLTAAQFNAKFRRSAVRRARRRGYLRNVCIALGNARRPESAEALGSALSDPEPLIRRHAAWALSRLGTEEARALLHAALENETDPEVLAELRAGPGLASSHQFD